MWRDSASFVFVFSQFEPRYCKIYNNYWLIHRLRNVTWEWASYNASKSGDLNYLSIFVPPGNPMHQLVSNLLSTVRCFVTVSGSFVCFCLSFKTPRIKYGSSIYISYHILYQKGNPFEIEPLDWKKIFYYKSTATESPHSILQVQHVPLFTVRNISKITMSLNQYIFYKRTLLICF